MASTDDIPRISRDTLDSIRARMGGRANLGVAPDDPRFLDSSLGQIWADLSGPVALEVLEMRQVLDEYVRAANPATTFGEYLDDWATSLGLERRDASYAAGTLRIRGTLNTTIPEGRQFTTLAPSEDVDPVAFLTTASATLASTPDGSFGQAFVPVVAVVAGPTGNLPPGSITQPTIQDANVTSVTNTLATTQGSDFESDERLTERLLIELASEHGAGTRADYTRWALRYPGVGSVQVVPQGDGPGTIVLFLLDFNSDPVQQPLIDTVQAGIDPNPRGQGFGIAPVNANVRVTTAVTQPVAISATIRLRPGYSLTGSDGNRPVQPDVVAAVRAYVDGLGVGARVVRNRVISAIIRASDGVDDVTALTIGSDDGNVNDDGNVDANEVASLSTCTLSAATS